MESIKRWLSGLTVGALAMVCIFTSGMVSEATAVAEIRGSSEDQQNHVKTPLNEAVLKRLFAKKLNSSQQKYEISNVKMATGHLIDGNSMSAIVSFHDGNASHAEGWAKLWILIYENGWKLKREIASTDSIKFKIVNLGTGIRPAVWLQGSHMGQGHEDNYGELLLLGQKNDDKLFEYSGHNSCATLLKDAGFDEHEIEFKHIDGDNFIEILDTEKKGKCNKEGDQIVKRTIKSVYKFNGKKYEKSNDAPVK